MNFDGVRAAAATLVILGAPRIAHAEVRVERSAGAESCPDAPSFRERIREGGAAPEVGPSAEITVRFERTGETFRSSVRVAGGEPRSLVDDAPDCEGLAEATALAVKLALDLEAARPRTPVSVPAPETPPVAPPAGSAAPAHGLPEARARALGDVSVSGVVAFGLVNPVAYGLRAGVAVVLDRRERWTLGLSGVALPAQSTDIGEGTVDVSLQGAGLEGCGRVRAGRTVLLALCGRVEAMRIAGESRGFDRTEQQARALATSSLLARARTTIAGPVAVFVEVGTIVPFVRQRFTIDTVGVVYDPPPAAGSAGIGIAVDFE